MARKKLSVKDIQIGNAYQHAKDRARKQNLPFNITLKYLRETAGDECPVFHTQFDWGTSGLGPGKFKPNGPQLDRIEPELGYVIGNVAFISHRANRLKDNGTMQDHYDIADWLWTHLYAKKNATPPVPKRTNLQGAVGAELGSVSTPWAWEDYDHTNDYRGATRGENTYHSAKEGSGNGMGCGSKEVGTSETPQSQQDNWELHPTYGWIERRG